MVHMFCAALYLRIHLIKMMFVLSGCSLSLLPIRILKIPVGDEGPKWKVEPGLGF